MPTFQAGFVHFEKEASDSENLQTLMEAYNALVARMNYTLNHLDDENMNTVFLDTIHFEEV